MCGEPDVGGVGRRLGDCGSMGTNGSGSIAAGSMCMLPALEPAEPTRVGTPSRWPELAALLLLPLRGATLASW